RDLFARWVECARCVSVRGGVRISSSPAPRPHPPRRLRHHERYPRTSEGDGLGDGWVMVVDARIRTAEATARRRSAWRTPFEESPRETVASSSCSVLARCLLGARRAQRGGVGAVSRKRKWSRLIPKQSSKTVA